MSEPISHSENKLNTRLQRQDYHLHEQALGRGALRLAIPIVLGAREMNT